MVITFSNIKGSTGSGGATGGTVSGITLWSDETTKAYIDNALSGVTDVLSAYTKTEDFATINGSAITSGGNIVIEATPYTAGTNIDITDHIISVTGITMPTKVSELVNDSGYITTADTQNFVTSGDVQTQINDSISGKADSSAVTAQISEVKQEIEAKIPSKVSDLQNDLNFVNSGDVKTQVESYNYINSGQAQTQIDNSISGKVDNSALTQYYTSEETDTAISNAVSGKMDTSAISAYTKTEDFATINGSAITSGGNIVVEETPYSGGSNIDITGHIISVTGITVPTKLSELTNDEGFVNSGEVETQITDKGYITGYTETDPVFMASAASGITSQDITNWNNKLESSDLEPYYTSAQTDTAISNATSGKQDTLVSGTNIKTINSQSLLGSGNIEIQGGGETYSAGEGIGIDANNIISVTGNYETIVELTQAEYDALTSYDKNTTYVITDAPAVNLSAYTPTSGFSTINGNVITDGGNIVIEGGNTYTAGANIDISTDNVISVTGITVPTSNTAFTNDAGYVTSGEVESQITNKDYPTKNWVQDNINLAIESETARTESTYAKIGDIPSLDGYATTGWVESQGYLTEHQDISGKLDTSVFTTYTANTQTELNNKQDASAMTAYATTAFTESTYLKEHQSLSAYSTTEQVQTLINTAKQEVENEIPDVSNFVTSAQVETQITNKGYITGYTESDPVFQASAASRISAQDITNWNAKLDSSALTPYYTSAQTDNAISNAVSGKADSSAVTAQISEVKAQIEAEMPSKVSDLQNDLNFASTGDVESMISGFTTSADVKTQIEGYNYINSGQAQTQINNSISGKLDTDIFTTYTANTQTELNNKQDISGMTAYYTSAQTDTAIQNATNGLASEEWVNNQGFLKEHQSLSAYSTTEQMNQAIGSATAATTGWVESQGYLTEHQSLSAYTPTSGFSTINGSAITEGGNIVIEGGSSIKNYQPLQVEFSPNYSFIDAYEISSIGTQQFYKRIAFDTINGNSIIHQSDNDKVNWTIPTSTSALTNDSGYVTSGEVNTQIESKGYITGYTETDPVFQASAASRISAQDISNWNGKQPSGDYALRSELPTVPTSNTAFTNDAGYITDAALNGYATTAFTEQTYLKEHQSLSAYTPTSGFSTINGSAITEGGNIVIEETPYSAGTNIDITGHIISVTGITIPTSNTAFTNDAGYVNSGEVETQITSKGYITGFTETDPVFQASAASGISEQDITNWNNKLDSSALNPYYTSAQTNTAISNAVSGKTDKVSVTASGSGYKFPKWNNQGCITGTSATAYQAFHNINGSNRTVYSDSSEALPTIYAPTSEGLAGQPLLSNGSGAPVWGAYKFQFISQSQYDALATKDSTTIYFIVNEN